MLQMALPPSKPRMSPAEAQKILLQQELKKDKLRYKDGKRVAVVTSYCWKSTRFPNGKLTSCRLARDHLGECSPFVAHAEEDDLFVEETAAESEVEVPETPAVSETTKTRPIRHGDRLYWRCTTILSSAEKYDVLMLMPPDETISEWVRVAVRQRIEREKHPSAVVDATSAVVNANTQLAEASSPVVFGITPEPCECHADPYCEDDK